jgi:hypothetical protein
MQETKEKLKRFLVRSARDVASQALPNWAQIALCVAQNFNDIFLACPAAEQAALLNAAREVTEAEWQSIRAQVSSELGEEYARALDQARGAMRGAGGVAELPRRLEETMGVRLGAGRALSPGVAVSVLAGGPPPTPTPRERWPQVPGFELTGWLGRGAAGEVFVARRLGGQGRVALKVGPLHDRARFEREVGVMERVRSPYVVSALSHGVIEGYVPLFWIEMPLMGGQTMAEALGGGLEEGLRLCVGVWRGLLALHEAGVAHRDLKPANVLLTAGGEPRVCDFGLSKRVEGAESVTHTGDAFGTPAYMSPEAVRGEPVGLAADVWAFGVMVCEVLGGRSPFIGQVAGEVWASILRDRPDVLGVPERFRAGVLACLAKGVSERPRDASELRGGLVKELELALSELEGVRREAARRDGRRRELRGWLEGEGAAVTSARGAFLGSLRGLSLEDLERHWDSLHADRQRRLEAASLEQRRWREELERLEAQGQRLDLMSDRPQGATLSANGARQGEALSQRTHFDALYEKYEVRGAGAVRGVEFRLITLPQRGVAVAQTQVTQALWEAVMGSNPSCFQGVNRPVERVSWGECVRFLNLLSRKVGLTPAYDIKGEDARLISGASGFRLPLEAEWEWAARGGEPFEYAGSEDVSEVGCFKGNARAATTEVATLQPNGYGLYDMSGNVWEWCADDYYNVGKHTPRAAMRVTRGGSWSSESADCRVTSRDWIKPNKQYDNLGLRLFRSLES